MFGTLYASVLLSSAALFYVTADQSIFKLPLVIGWATWSLLVILSSLLAWSGIHVWARLRLNEHESFVTTAKRLAGKPAGLLSLLISLACFALLVRISVVQIKPVNEYSFHYYAVTFDTIFFWVINAMVINWTFVSQMNRGPHSVQAIFTVLSLGAWLVAKVVEVFLYAKVHESRAIVLENLLDFATACRMGTVLTMGAMIPIALPEVCKLFNLPERLFFLLAIIPQLCYVVLSLLSCFSEIPGINSWWNDLYPIWYFFGGMSAVAVLSLIMRPILAPPADHDEEQGKQPIYSSSNLLMLGFSFLAFSCGMVVAIWPKALLLQKSAYLALMLGSIPQILLLAGPITLWVSTKAMDRPMLSLALMAAIISVAGIGHLGASLVSSGGTYFFA